MKPTDAKIRRVTHNHPPSTRLLQHHFHILTNLLIRLKCPPSVPHRPIRIIHLRLFPCRICQNISSKNTSHRKRRNFFSPGGKPGYRFGGCGGGCTRCWSFERRDVESAFIADGKGVSPPYVGASPPWTNASAECDSGSCLSSGL
jgi:hypothetical protein